MNVLGIESDEDLFLLMAQAHLPMPRLPDRETKAMVDTFVTVQTPTKPIGTFLI